MTTQHTSREILEVLLRRFAFVDALAEEARDKRTLVAELTSSRSTVDRSIRELETLGVAEYVDGEYRLTPFGEMVRSGLLDFDERLELWSRFGPFLEWLSQRELERELDVGLLSEAELYLPEPGDPWAMVNRHVTVAAQANELECVLPLTGLHAHQAIRDRVVEEGARSTVVTTPEVVRTYQSDPAYAPLTEEMAETGRFALYQYDDPVPCFVGLLDETVQVGVDDDGEPKALVEGESAALREWAETTFTAFRRKATPVVTAADTVEH